MSKIDPMAYMFLGIESLQIAKMATPLIKQISVLKKHTDIRHILNTHEPNIKKNGVSIHSRVGLRSMRINHKCMAESLSVETLFAIESDDTRRKLVREKLIDYHQQIKYYLNELKLTKPDKKSIKGKAGVIDFKNK